jgi:hypothetical protein
MELVSNMGRVEFCFSPFGHSVSISEHTIGIEIILDALDGTPR